MTNRKQKTKLETSYSSGEDIKHGVPQISIIGPVLFNIFVCDMFLMLDQALCLLQTHSPLQSQTCNRPSLPPKWLKMNDVPIPLSCHFSAKTHHGNFNLFVRLIPKYDLQRQSFTNTVTQR